MVRILSSDLLICDLLLPKEAFVYAAPLIQAYDRNHPDHRITPGSKSPLAHAEFLDWHACLGPYAQAIAGGSAANTLSALKRCMGNALHIQFIAAYGDDRAGHVIAEALREDGFALWPRQEAHPLLQTAQSFVLVDASGERSILGYPGTAQEVILGAWATQPHPMDYDILFLPGSLWQKYGSAFAHTLASECLAAEKPLWLSLPTHSQTKKEYSAAVHALIPKAQILLANRDELSRLLGVPETSEAFRILRSMMHPAQHAFITDGRAGAYLLTNEHSMHIPACSIPEASFRNTLGAGDAAFAGFLCGMLRGVAASDAAVMGMEMAALALQHDGARLRALPRWS